MQHDSSEVPSLKGLKILFYAMILILLGGVLFLFVTLKQQNQAKQSHTQKPCIREDIYHRNIVGMNIVATHQENQTLILVLQRGDAQAIRMIDLCSGEIIKSIYFKDDQ